MNDIVEDKFFLRLCCFLATKNETACITASFSLITEKKHLQLFQHFRQLRKCINGIRIIRNRTKAVPCPNEWNTSLRSGIAVALGITHVDGMFDVIAAHDELDVLALTQTSMAEIFRVGEVAAQLVRGQEGFDVAFLAVADDK